MFNIKLSGVSAQSYSDSCTYNSSVGNLSLSVQTYGEFYCTSAYRTERSGMNQHLLIYTLAGKGRLLYRRKEYSLTAGTLMLIEGSTGTVLATLALDGNVEGSPAVFDDMLVVGTRAGSIYGIRLS